IREGVRVLADEQRAGNPLAGAVLHNRLRDGGDVVLVEGGLQAGAAVPGGAEGHALGRVGRVRLDVEVGVPQRGQVYKVAGEGYGARTVCHASSMPKNPRIRSGPESEPAPTRTSGARLDWYGTRITAA